MKRVTPSFRIAPLLSKVIIFVCFNASILSMLKSLLMLTIWKSFSNKLLKPESPSWLLKKVQYSCSNVINNLFWMWCRNDYVQSISWILFNPHNLFVDASYSLFIVTKIFNFVNSCQKSLAYWRSNKILTIVWQFLELLISTSCTVSTNTDTSGLLLAHTSLPQLTVPHFTPQTCLSSTSPRSYSLISL